MRKPECLNRLEGSRKAICLNSSLPTFKRPVKPKDCRECSEDTRLIKLPVSAASKPTSGTPSETLQEAHTGLPEITPLGTLIFTRTHWEPPPCPPGYHRADTEAAWVLKPDVPVCKYLELGSGEVGSCGYPRLTRHCQLVKSFVGPKTCETCTKRDSNAG